MALKAIHPEPKTPRQNPQNKICLYRLQGLKIDRTKQDRASDVTYIPMETGFVYLTVIMDCSILKVPNWRPSNSPGASSCVDALKEVIIVAVRLRYSTRTRVAGSSVMISGVC